MPKGSVYVIDTHAFVWYLEDSRNLSASARLALNEIGRGDSFGIVPSIVLAEIMHLSDRHKISIGIEEIVLRIERASNLIVLPLGMTIIRLMIPLKDFELHDRVIIATARHVNAPLITRDEQIRNRSGLRCIW